MVLHQQICLPQPFRQCFTAADTTRRCRHTQRSIHKRIANHQAAQFVAHAHSSGYANFSCQSCLNLVTALATSAAALLLNSQEPCFAASSLQTRTSQASQVKNERLEFPQSFPALGAISELPIQEVMLSDGLRVFLIEDHEVPIVKATIAFKGGQRASPPDKVGLANLAATVMRSGGSLQHPSTQLDNTLEELAAGIEGFALPEAMLIGFQSLKEDVPQVAGLLAELLTSPALPPEKMALFKNQAVAAIEHRNDSSRQVVRRELLKLIYGRNSIYARQPTIEQVSSIQRDDVVAFLDKWVHPEGALMGVLGDFDSSEMKRLLEDKFGRWQPAAGQAPPEAASSSIPEYEESVGSVFFIDQPGATQASVAMGELGVEMSAPDTPALEVLNEILNSFGGSLFNEIRSREGLAYSVAGGFDTSAIGHPGLFIAAGETAALGDFVTSLQRLLQEATTKASSQDILQAAKDKTLNSFVFNFASSEAQLQRILGFTLLGIPQDYLFSYRDRIQAVTAEDVLQAAQRHLHPFRQRIVVAADAQANEKELEKIKETRPLVFLELE